MAESFVQLNNDGPGKKIDTFTESTNGQHRQAMVVSDPSVTGGTATVDPVNGLSVAPKTLPPNAAQETGGNLAAIKADLDTIKTNTTQLATTQPVSLTGTTSVSGTVTAVQPTGTNLHIVVDSAPTTAITAASLPLPSGAATSANQTSEITQLTTIANNTPPNGQALMAASSPVVIASNQSAIPVTLASTTITGNVTVVQPTGANLNAAISNFPATQPVSGTVTANQGTANATPWNENIAQIAGTTTSTAAAGTQKVGITGNTAATLDGVITAATSPANGLAILTVAQTTPPSMSAGQSVAVQCDYVGSAFVKPYRRSQTVSKATTIAASTTATTVLAAQAAGIFADITTLSITVTPSSTVTAFTCTLSDGTNSYIFDVMTGLTTTATPGLAVNVIFNPPLPATTAATAWTVTNSSATPTVHINVVAVLQKAS